MNIRGKRIILRAIEVEDLHLLHKWVNDPDLVESLGEIHFPSSFQQQEIWLNKIHKDENTIRLAVQDIEGHMMGYSGFWNIQWRDRRTEHALIIGDMAYRGKGYGKEIIMTCARYAFEEMGLFRLDANILETNIPSLKIYQSCGFKIEGVLRGHAFRRGNRVNRVMLGMLVDEYYESIQKTQYWKILENSK